MNCIRIATRSSPLAIQQTNIIKSQIQQKFPEIKIELVEFITEGDKNLLSTLSNKRWVNDLNA